MRRRRTRDTVMLFWRWGGIISEELVFRRITKKPKSGIGKPHGMESRRLCLVWDAFFTRSRIIRSRSFGSVELPKRVTSVHFIGLADIIGMGRVCLKTEKKR